MGCVLCAWITGCDREIHELNQTNGTEREIAKVEGRRADYEALLDIYETEGFGGREDVDSIADAREVCEERLTWYRDQREEGLR